LNNVVITEVTEEGVIAVADLPTEEEINEEIIESIV